jgi:hypothetical protein
VRGHNTATREHLANRFAHGLHSACGAVS